VDCLCLVEVRAVDYRVTAAALFSDANGATAVPEASLAEEDAS
jgi:hypothetical protein